MNFKITLAFLIALHLASVSFAQEPTQKPQAKQNSLDKLEKKADEIADQVQDSGEKIAVDASGSRFRRMQNEYFVLGSYAPFDLLIPSKMGLTLGLIKDPGKTWEFEYLNGSLSAPFVLKDLGNMNDTRYSLIARTYSERNSFNLSYGVSFFDFSIHLGNDLMNRITGTRYPSMDVVSLQSLGFNLGLGNRWSFNKNITLGIDWLTWSQPLVMTKKQAIFLDHVSNADDRESVEKAINIVSYTPRFSFLKLQLGILF